MCELSRRKAKLVTRHLSVGTGWLTFSVCVSILWSAVANASPQRQWLGARPVERSLVLPHGWSEVSVSWDHHRADGGFGLDGSRADWIRPMHMEAFTTALRFGLVPRVEAFSSVETVRLAADEEIRVGIGGANLGTRVELWASALPLSSLTAEVAYQLPIGTNVPSTTRAEAPTGGELAVGTGASQFLPALRFRTQLGALRLETGVVGNVSLPTRVGSSGDRTDWGDGFGLDGTGLVQIGPVAIATTVFAMRWGDDRVNGVRVPSAGWQIDMSGGAVVSVNRSVDLVVAWRPTLMGRPTAFAGAAHLSPTHGPRHHLGVVFRW
ncbi:MAG: hypothetical protein ACJAZO_003292 [Myxococcota bacterium]|jgi:hypothetical protein